MPPDAPVNRLEVTVSDRQRRLAVDVAAHEKLARWVLADAGIVAGVVGLRIVEDAEIRRLNSQYLGHDWATDVISFPIDDSPQHFCGDVVVSAEMAHRVAEEQGTSATDELLLYTLHGLLHLVGHDDKSDDRRQAMRAAEIEYLQRLGATVAPVVDGEEEDSVAPRTNA